MSLKLKSIFGVLWSFLDSFIAKGIMIFTSLIIARIIGPKEYGLYGMIVIFITIGTSLMEGGLSSSIIRSKKIDNSDLSTVFYINVSISFVIYSLLYLLSPYISIFYNEIQVAQLIKVCCLNIIISSFSSVQIAILTREMKFKIIFQCNFIATLISSIIGVFSAVNDMKIWSLIFMYIGYQLTYTILVWKKSHWKPTLLFSMEKLKAHYSFGFKLMLAGLLDKSFRNIYNVVIGKFFNPLNVGYFERSNSLSSFPSMTLSNIIGRVTYPMLSQIQDDKKKIYHTYKLLIKITFFISAPLMLSLGSIAIPLFELILGDEWIPSISLFQILCLGSLFYSVNAFNLNILKVYGRSDLFLKLEILKKIIIVVVIFFSFQYGIYALVWSSVLTSVISLFINTYYSGEMIGYGMRKQLSYILPQLFLSVVIFYPMYLLGFELEKYNHIVRIFTPLTIGYTIYFLINYITKNESLLYLFHLIKKTKTLNY